KKCYIVTKDTVLYGNIPGIDSKTGRECRPVTLALLPRLREYEKGNRPKRITASDPTFFDPRTGEAIVWYYKDAAGNIELFDLMGFDPRSGEELTPINKAVANAWLEKRKDEATPKRVPKPVKISADTQFFDPATGTALLWYWRAGKGEYEFFDSSG